MIPDYQTTKSRNLVLELLIATITSTKPESAACATPRPEQN